MLTHKTIFFGDSQDIWMTTSQILKSKSNLSIFFESLVVKQMNKVNEYFDKGSCIKNPHSHVED